MVGAGLGVFIWSMLGFFIWFSYGSVYTKAYHIIIVGYTILFAGFRNRFTALMHISDGNI